MLKLLILLIALCCLCTFTAGQNEEEASPMIMTFSYVHPTSGSAGATADSSHSDVLPPPMVTSSESTEVVTDSETEQPRANSTLLMHRRVESVLPALSDDQVNVSMIVIPVATHRQHGSDSDSEDERDSSGLHELHHRSSRLSHERELDVAVNVTNIIVRNATVTTINSTRVHETRITHRPALNESSIEEEEGMFNSTSTHTLPQDPHNRGNATHRTNKTNITSSASSTTALTVSLFLLPTIALLSNV